MKTLWFAGVVMIVVQLHAGTIFAQVVYNFQNPGSGGSASWGDPNSWNPTGTPSAADIARFNTPNPYAVSVNGSFAIRALQIASAPAQTNTLSFTATGGNGSSAQITLAPGTGANGSLAEFNGRTTLFAQTGAGTVTLNPIMFLGGGTPASEGTPASPAQHVWEIQSGATVDVRGQMQATVYGGSTLSGNTLTKVGGGTLVISATSNFASQPWTGGLTVAGGTVRANSVDFATGLGPVTVTSGGTLGGHGRISSPITIPGQTVIQSGGTLAGGTAAGTSTLTIANSNPTLGLRMDAGSRLRVSLFGTGTTDIGRVSVQGTALINTDQIALDLSGLNATQVAALRQNVLASGGTRTYTVMSATGELTGSGFNAGGFSISDLGHFTPGDWSFGTFDTNSRIVTVVFTPVPEPRAALAVAAVAALLVRSLRRRRERMKANASPAPTA